MVDSKRLTGYLVLADISGYTFFLANTELEHADIALSYLLEVIVQKMGSLLTISKLEGDGVFAFIEENRLPEGRALVDLIDQTYQAFREKANTLYQGSTCECKACKAIPTLDLKFMVHHGDFLIQQVAGIRDLLGSDINLVHRLAKNGVAEATGWRGYALFSRKVLPRLHLDETKLLRRMETYEHLGEVETFVLNLSKRKAVNSEQ